MIQARTKLGRRSTFSTYCDCWRCGVFGSFLFSFTLACTIVLFLILVFG